MGALADKNKTKKPTETAKVVVNHEYGDCYIYVHWISVQLVVHTERSQSQICYSNAVASSAIHVSGVCST